MSVQIGFLFFSRAKTIVHFAWCFSRYNALTHHVNRQLCELLSRCIATCMLYVLMYFRTNRLRITERHPLPAGGFRSFPNTSLCEYKCWCCSNTHRTYRRVHSRIIHQAGGVGIGERRTMTSVILWARDQITARAYLRTTQRKRYELMFV